MDNGLGKNNEDSYREYERILTFEVSSFNGSIAELSGILRGYTMLKARVFFVFRVNQSYSVVSNSQNKTNK